MGSQITPTGIRWQVWLSVFGGLGVLAYVAFVMTSGKPEQQEREDDLPVVQKRRSSSSVNWGPSGYRRRAQKLRAVSARPSQRAKAPTRARVVDGGGKNEAVPEKAAQEKRIKIKRVGWIRGKVVALPAKSVIKSFTVVYARAGRGGFWRRSRVKKGKDGFPVGAKKLSKSFTNAKGEFDLKLKAGSYILQVKSKGFEPGNPTFAFASRRRWFRQTFGLLRAGTCSILGKVVGNNNKPLPGAKVVALISGGSRWGWRMLSMGRGAPSAARKSSTNGAGEFSLQRLPAGGYGVAIHAPGFIAWRQRGIKLAPGEIKDLGVIRLNGNTGAVQGIVYGPDAQPMSGVRVIGFARGKNGRTVRFSRTNSSGKFLLKDLPAGTVRVIARKGRRFSGARQMKSVEIKVGQTLKLNIRFGVGGMTLKGKVMQADGTPVAGAKVNARPSGRRFWRSNSGEATTDENGNYSISGLKEGMHTLVVTIQRKPAPGGTVDVRGAETLHNIQLQGGQIEIVVTDKATKKPLKVAAFAMLSWKGSTTQRLMQSGKAGETIKFKNLPNVSMNLRIYCSGYSAVVKSGLYPGNSGKAEKVFVELAPAGKMLLTLKTPDKKVPDRVWARILINNKYQWVPSSPTAGGDLLVRTLPPGTVHLQINARGYQPLKVTVEVPNKETGKATFFLTPKPTSPSIKKPTR